MINWLEKQRNCDRCKGFGYNNSEAKHRSGRGPAWASKCICQPITFDEMQEAVDQEEVRTDR